jgi:hypothetical protein
MARKEGFTGLQLVTFNDAFGTWKSKEKSRMAKIKNANRKKKGQV